MPWVKTFHAVCFFVFPRELVGHPQKRYIFSHNEPSRLLPPWNLEWEHDATQQKTVREMTSPLEIAIDSSHKLGLNFREYPHGTNVAPF